MSILIVVLILMIWGIAGLKDTFTPSAPPIDDPAELFQKLQSLPDQASRQRYLKEYNKRMR